MPAVKRAEFVSDRMLYIVLRGRWFDMIVLIVHAPTEDRNDDVKERFYEELERIFDMFPKYHMNILLGDFSVKWARNTFLIRQLAMKVYTKSVMIMELEQ
jgi:hypothetical protein